MQDFGAYQFAAFYLSAGMASSMTSYLARLRRGSGGRSLGASGAVYACFAATALVHPGPHCQTTACSDLHRAAMSGQVEVRISRLLLLVSWDAAACDRCAWSLHLLARRPHSAGRLAAAAYVHRHGWSLAGLEIFRSLWSSWWCSVWHPVHKVWPPHLG